MVPSRASDTPLLEVEDVHCCYGGLDAVHRLHFSVSPGKIVCLLGPSGCGKTTTLRAIAGFEPLCNGEIRLRGKPISTPTWTLPPEQRRMGMVFQDYALFPHLTIHDNVTFGLRHLPRRERRARAEELLELVDLKDHGERYPHELSGGQQQRVSLIRAVAPRPDVVLLDEPFSNLDVDLRERLSRQFHDIFRDQGVTALLVTHDQHEAFAMADEIGLMRQGRIVQWDTAFNLYHEPAERFVAEFIGQGTLVHGTVRDPVSVESELGVLNSRRRLSWPPGMEVDVLLRPDELRLDEQGPIRARVVKYAFKGAETLYTLECDSGQQLLALASSAARHVAGDEVRVAVQTDRLVTFPREPAAGQVRIWRPPECETEWASGPDPYPGGRPASATTQRTADAQSAV